MPNFLRTATLNPKGYDPGSRVPTHIEFSEEDARGALLQGRFAFINTGTLLLNMDNGKQVVLHLRNCPSYTKEEPLVDALATSFAAAGIKLPEAGADSDVKDKAEEEPPQIGAPATTNF